MKEPGFLGKLKKKGILRLVEPSEEIKESYLEKSANSLKASEVLLKTKLLEEAVSMGYYAMYHSLLALMFKCGIKCENHAGNIIILKGIFNENELHDTISDAKEERIDKQYYVDFEITEKDVSELVVRAGEFATKIKLLMESLTTDAVERIREKLK